jgi:hypothetical protein
MLVIGTDDLMAVFLGDEFQFEAMPSSNAEGWSGVFVAGIELRADLSSIFELDNYYPPLGAITYGRDGLCVVAKIADNRAFARNKRIPVGSLGTGEKFSCEVGIKRWEIGKTIGEQWVSLWKVSAHDPGA